MKKIAQFFKQRWVISLLGVIAISLLIWFIGPFLGFAGREPLASPVVRLIVILVIVLIWGANNMRRQMKANKANNEIMEGLTESPGDAGAGASQSAEEIAILRERFEEAMAVLKKSRGKKGRATSLYELPWYIIIGPPGSGKTTALVNSGLEFPLADRFGKESLQGVGGTRNCDWWFTNEAILLDTAGRYVTQDSHAQVDSAAWDGFLDLLKRYRKRRPINGVMVAISLQDLMIQSEQERNAHVYAIKQRVQELYKHFGIRFPIYVLLTKSDLVAGFMEFFDDLGHDERAQVWGMTFPLEMESETGAVEQFGREFDALLRRLNDRLTTRLAQERDLRRRSLIYAFPGQMAALKQALDQFLREVFRPSRFEDPPLLRGVYLTSGTQEGTPIDRLMGSIARTFGLDQQGLPAFSGQGRSYFITALLKRVVFGEAEIAGTNLRLERQRAWLQRGAYAGALVLTLLAVLAWFASYARNRVYVADVNEQTAAAAQNLGDLRANDRDVLAVLPVLNAVRDIPGGAADADKGTPLLMGMGLYQGDKLGSEAKRAYDRVLHNQFLPRLMFRLEDQMRLGATPDYKFEALKSYLMLEDPEHYDAAYIKEWLAWDWEQTLPRDIGEQPGQDLRGHLDALLGEEPPQLQLALDANQTRATQRELAGIRPAQRIYGQVQRAPEVQNLREFRIDEWGGPDVSLVFRRRSGEPLNRGISGLYTYEGFYKFFLDEARRLVGRFVDESWVLGEYQPRQAAASGGQFDTRLFDEVLQLYERDYGDTWEDMLEDLEVIPFNRLQQAVETLRTLSGSTSPMRNLLEAVASETILDEPPIPLEEAAAVADKAAQGLKSRFRRLGVDAPSAGSAVEKLPGHNVSRKFEQLNRLVEARGAGLPLDDVLLQLDGLYRYLNAIARSGDPGDSWRNQQQGRELLDELNTTADRQPAPVDRWLRSLTGESRSLTAGGVRQHLNAAWSTDVLSFCQRAIAERYPFVRNSPREVTLEDFGHFFGPNGLVDTFFSTYLKDLVDTTHDPWRLRPSASGAIKVSAATLGQFQRAALIKDSFFRIGGKTPQVRFELKPIGMDRNINRFQLDLEGQQVPYAHGPSRPFTLQWPGSAGPKQVRIQVSPSSPGGRSGLTEDGAWAWFRLLDRSNMIEGERPERFNVTFDLDGRQARFELWASSVINPFSLSELEKFSCPPRL